MNIRIFRSKKPVLGTDLEQAEKQIILESPSYPGVLFIKASNDIVITVNPEGNLMVNPVSNFSGMAMFNPAEVGAKIEIVQQEAV